MIDPAASNPPAPDIWTDVDALDQWTRRADARGEAMAAVIFAAAQQAAARRAARSRRTSLDQTPTIALAGDDDRDTVDLQVVGRRRRWHWAAMIACTATAALVWTGNLRLPAIEHAVARQPIDLAPIAPDVVDVTPDPPPAPERPAPKAERDNTDHEVKPKTRNLFDEPLEPTGDSHRVPTPSLFGPDPIAPAATPDLAANGHYAKDVAEWIAAHRETSFPAPRRIRRTVTIHLPPSPSWLDQIIHDAVHGQPPEAPQAPEAR